LLGQMAAEDYPERLPALYLELREAALFSRLEKNTAGQSLLDLLSGTEKFFSKYVVRTLNEEWGGMHRWLEAADGSNPYLARIQRNVSRAMAMARALQGVAPISSRGANLG